MTQPDTSLSIEQRLDALERRLARLEPHVNRLMPLGPGIEREKELEAQGKDELDKICKAIAAKQMESIPLVDRAAQQLASGEPVPADRSHTKLKDNGQQEAYIVLTPEERAKGFVRPVRRTYIHKVCGFLTSMSRDIAETYARDPKFYSGTFCLHCGKHFSLDQFVWNDAPGEQVGS